MTMYKLLVWAIFLGLLALPACAKTKRAAATSGAAVQQATAKVGNGVDKVGDTLHGGLEKTVAKIDRAGDKVDHAAKKLGEKLED